MNEYMTEVGAVYTNTVRCYFIEVEGSPVMHYLFLTVELDVRATTICGAFNIYLN
jgi:hypothetical protein